MVSLVGVVPYQPDGRQTENVLLMLAHLIHPIFRFFFSTTFPALAPYAGAKRRLKVTCTTEFENFPATHLACGRLF
jgi:hypothetical protein